MQSSCNSDCSDLVYVCGKQAFAAWYSWYCNILATSPVSPTTDVSKLSGALWTHYLQYKSSSWCVFCLKNYHNCFYVKHLCLVIQDNKNDVLNQRSLAPDSAMFGLPGTGHSKPAIHSPGLYLVLLVHHLIPSCFNSSWTPSTHVLAWDLLWCFCKAALNDPHFNMTNISPFSSIFCEHHQLMFFAWDLLWCFCKAASNDPHFNMTSISFFASIVCEHHQHVFFAWDSLWCLCKAASNDSHFTMINIRIYFSRLADDQLKFLQDWIKVERHGHLQWVSFHLYSLSSQDLWRCYILIIEINVRCLHREFCSLICCSSAWQKISVLLVMALLL
jgi:hypothetical protein